MPELEEVWMPEEENSGLAIAKYLEMTNIAKDLDDDILEKISTLVIRGYDIDENSRSQWLTDNKEALELAMQIGKVKNTPLTNSANVKYPLLTTAALQFSSRAYPNIVKGRNVVKGKVVGKDESGEKAAKAKRISQHMSYQCLDEMEEWEVDMDILLTVLPIIGCAFKKTYFSSVMQRNVSEYVPAKDLVIHYFAKSMERAPRMTHIIPLYPYEIEERKRSGVFLDIDLGQAVASGDEDEQHDTIDEDKPHIFLEQHRWYDLDKDGYEEPYIVTVHKQSKKIVRITARYDLDGIKLDDDGKIRKITPIQHFTKFPFLPNPDGSIYDFGFGRLLTPINRTINSTLNMLLDSGRIRNSQSGLLGKGVQIGKGRTSGPIKLKLNEWTPVSYMGDDIRKSMLPIPTHEPSTVLFQLLGFMVQAGETVSSVSEVLTGEQSIHNEPATTTLARIEQGLKVFSAIHKRTHRSLKSEFRKLKRLNQLYLEENSYYTVLDTPQAIARTDYDDKDIDVFPVSDPMEVSDTQRLVKAQALFGAQGRGYNDNLIRRKYLEAIQAENIDELMKAPKRQPDPKMVVEMQKLKLESQKLQIEKQKLQFEMMKFQHELPEIQSKIIKNIADAESKEAGQQMEFYKEQLKFITEQSKIALQKETNEANKSAGNGGVATPSSNEGSVS
jgi:chaperonin GroES